MELIKVENGVKQGDLLTPTLFSIYFAMFLFDVFVDCNDSIMVMYRTSGKLYNVHSKDKGTSESCA